MGVSNVTNFNFVGRNFFNLYRKLSLTSPLRALSDWLLLRVAVPGVDEGATRGR